MEGLNGFAAIFGNTAANENTISIRRERDNKTLGSLKADVVVGTCTVSATELW